CGGPGPRAVAAGSRGGEVCVVCVGRAIFRGLFFFLGWGFWCFGGVGFFKPVSVKIFQFPGG
ncbi:hypothetical protein, partial [Stenotrophomonas maltophilia]|uniref:hypothetical protein n=1 Tax=Stenotrophomonas maltophilia TaxID=40324 RepID=UPI0031455B31